MKHFMFLCLAASLLAACHESIEDRADREAREYTQRYCPTPVENNTRTDSVVFDKATRTYTYYCTFSGMMDNADVIGRFRQDLHERLVSSIRQSTELRAYKDAAFIFAYVCHSAKNPQKVIFSDRFLPEEYGSKK